MFEQAGELGRGGMGVVYRVRDRRLGRQAALKLALSEDPALLARFRREAEITARLDHPGIPPVYEAGTTSAGKHYMLMRVVEGQTLEDAIARAHGDFAPLGREGTIGELLGALARVAEAVAYAHSQGVIHRDLKPENVLLGSFGEVLLMDWGLARDLRSDETEFLGGVTIPADAAQGEGGEAGLTQAGSVMGTPGYMAPEQASGEPAGTAADVFALGGLLVAILTGRPPIEGATALNRIAKTVQGQVQLPRDRRPDAPPELHALAAACLKTREVDRLPSAERFLRELRLYLGDAELSVYPYPARQRLLRWARRRAGLLVGLTALAGTLALVGVLGASLATARAQRLQAEAERAAAEAREQREARKRAEEEASRREAEEAARSAQRGLEREREGNEQTRALQRSMDELAEVQHEIASGRGGEETAARVAKVLEGPKARFLLWQAAQVYQDMERYAKARLVLEQSIQEYPPAYRERFALHRLRILEFGRRLRLEPSPQRRIELAPQGLVTEELYQLGATAAERGDVNVFVHIALAARALKLGLGDDVHEHLDRALELRPKLYEALLLKGAALARSGKKQEAVPWLRLVVEQRPRDPIAWALLTGIYNDSKEHERLLEAIDAVEDGARPTSVLAHDRAVVLCDLGRYDQALEEIERGFTIEKDDVELFLLKLQVLALAQRNKQAKALYEQLAQDPRCKERLTFHYWRARVGLELTDYKEAKESALWLQEHGRGRGEATLLLGRAQWLLDEDAAALTSFAEAARLLPKDERPRWFMARVHHVAKRFSEAVEAYTETIALAPKKTRAYTYRGLCRFFLRETEAARADFDEAIAIDAKERRAYSYRGRLELYQGDPALGITFLDAALELTASDNTGRMWRAACHHALGHTAEALRDIERALPFLRERPECHLWEGRIRVLNGQRAAARAAFEEGLRIEPAARAKNRGGFLGWEKEALEAELAKLGSE